MRVILPCSLRLISPIRDRSIVSLCRRNVTNPSPDIGLGARLQSDLKTALKSKNSLAATTIRALLSEVYATQKRSPAPLESSDILSIIRKAELRRLDSMKQFENASRLDLAEREQKEAALLSSYLPARLTIDEVDKILRQITAELPEKENAKKAKGIVLKTFYSQVDKNTVDGALVRQRLDEHWS